MGIKFLCDTCGKKLNIKEELAGKKGRCPKCDAVIKIPKQSMVSAESKVAAGSSSANKAEKQNEESVFVTQTSSAIHTKTPKVDKSRVEKSRVDKSKVDRSKVESESKQGSPPPVPESGGGSLETSSPEIPVQSSEKVDVGSKPKIGPPELKQDSQEDVFAANPDAKWFVRPSSGGQFGPAESEAMKTWLGEGRVGRDSLVWCEGWEEWQSAAEIFAEELGASPKQEQKKEKAPETSESNLNRAFNHQQARHRARMMGIFLIVGLALLSIALAVVLFIVVNNAAKQKDSDKENNENENSSALLYFPPTKNHNQIVVRGDLDLI